jgi:hypothetical protein
MGVPLTKCFVQVRYEQADVRGIAKGRRVGKKKLVVDGGGKM